MTSTRPKLRALREERSWTQQDVADQVARMAWLRRHERVGVNADMELAGGDLDEACASAGEAADSLRRAGYAVGLGRLREFRRSVEQWAGPTPVRALDEQLAVL